MCGWSPCSQPHRKPDYRLPFQANLRQTQAEALVPLSGSAVVELSSAAIVVSGAAVVVTLLSASVDDAESSVEVSPQPERVMANRTRRRLSKKTLKDCMMRWGGWRLALARLAQGSADLTQMLHQAKAPTGMQSYLVMQLVCLYTLTASW